VEGDGVLELKTWKLIADGAKFLKGCQIFEFSSNRQACFPTGEGKGVKEIFMMELSLSVLKNIPGNDPDGMWRKNGQKCSPRMA